MNFEGYPIHFSPVYCNHMSITCYYQYTKKAPSSNSFQTSAFVCKFFYCVSHILFFSCVYLSSKPPILPVSFADRLFHPLSSTLSRIPSSCAISYFSLLLLREVLPSDKLPLPSLCSCPQLLLYCFALIHSSLPSSIPVLSEYGHLFQKLYIVFRMSSYRTLRICTGSSLRNNNGSNDICPDPCPAKAGQDHPGKTYQCWINVEIFCNTAAYTAQHIIYR